MICIIDYGVGNLFSLCSSLEYIGAKAVISSDVAVIQSADKLILPGVGAFGDAAEKLRSTGLEPVIKAQAQKGKEIMGICLGMQLLFQESLEYGQHPGLGLLQGRVVPMENRLPQQLKIPHIGWNKLDFKSSHRLLKYIQEGDCVYFVHSFFAQGCEDSLIATADYGIPITAMVAKDNVMGCQFHPEKSGSVGLNILRAFCETE